MHDSPVKSISENESYIIQVIRSLKPFEQVVITADKMGKVNHFLLLRSSKILLTDSLPMHVA